MKNDMNIVLANFPWKSFGRRGVRAGSRWPHLKGPSEKDYLPFPFFLAYTADLLKKHGFIVTLIDAIAEEISYSSFLKLMKRLNPNLLLCETSTVTLEHDMRCLSKIGNGISIALCGPDINIREPEFLGKYRFIDYVLVGEYEFTFLDLVNHLREGKDLYDVSGLIYRESDRIRINPKRELCNLDDLPWPLREGPAIKNYNDTPGDMPIPSAQMLASRGCPYGCKFCLWPQVMYQGNKYRTRNIKDVVDEMEYLVREMKFKSIYFDDDTFNIGKDRVLGLCDEIKKRHLNIPWAIMARADLMDREILETMRDAGLFAVKYGVESAVQKQLDDINKNMDIKKTIGVIKLTKELGIRMHLTFTFGLPGETKESVLKTIDLALKLDPATIQFSLATPFPGTSFYRDMKEKGCIVSERWAEYDGNYKSVMASDTIGKKDLEFAIRLAYKKWSLHCKERNPFGRYSYYHLLRRIYKEEGFFTACAKTFKFTIRHLKGIFKDNAFCKRAEIEKRIKERGLTAGRLALLFEQNSINLYWDGMRLTRGDGIISLFGVDDKILKKSLYKSWNFEKKDNNECRFVKTQEDMPIDEVWRVKILDEKQIDWDVEVNFKENIEALSSKIDFILARRYRKWVDSWGEGWFYSMPTYREVELRNPKTDFIGLRGCKKIKGQLPTLYLDFSVNSNKCHPTIKNDESVLGAKVLGLKTKIINGDGGPLPNTHRLVSVRLKIVEENFNKRSERALRWEKRLKLKP